MGRVYSPNTVEMGGISLVPHHREAGAFMLQALFAHGEPLFDSAMIYGSTVDGPGPTIRSDLDILVVHNPGEDKARQAQITLGKIVEHVETTFKLTVEPQLHPAGEVGVNDDPLYAEHIVEVAETKPDWCINDPAKEYAKLKLAPEDREGRVYHALAYMSAKAVSFETALSEYAGFADYSVLQRALELPSANGRKILPATQRPGEVLPHISDKAGMRALLEQRIIDHFGPASAGLLESQRWLTVMDGRYTEILKETLEERDLLQMAANIPDSKKPTLQKSLIGEYDNWLEDIYVEVCTRAEELSRAWAILLEDEMARIAPHRFREFEALDATLYYGINDRS